jgi:hypothetical protein
MNVEDQIVGADGGVYVWTEIQGDFSHLPPHDRPPRYVRQVIREGRTLHKDRSADRKPIPQSYPGMPISDLHNAFRGPVAILFNGHSLAGHDLHAITCVTIGMNRTYVGHPTYKGPDTTFLCVMDRPWLYKPEVKAHPGLVNGSSDMQALGYRPPRSWRMRPFSFDLHRDGFVPPTTGHLALQLAVYMGFTDLYCLGLDFGGPHYDGTESGGNMSAQKKLTLEAFPLLKARGIRPWSCGNRYGIFEYAPFSAICRRAS